MQLELFVVEESYCSLTGSTQICKVCNKEKDLALFPRHAYFKTRVDNRCKSCIKKQTKLRKDLKKRFHHLKPEVCDCCGKEHHKSLVLDHDHNTLAFRGWICEPCNHGIGKLGDDMAGLEKALVYLRNHYERS